MRKYIILIACFLFVNYVLTACSTTDRPAQAVTEYMNALVSKDTDSLTMLSCAGWAPNALTEMNSFQAVTASLEGLSCKSTGSDGDTILVTCGGNIVTTYNGEQQNIDLSVRTYEVVIQGGEYLVCGYR